MDDTTVVIAGAGQAGFQTALSLRQEGFAGRIVLVGEEPGLPYQRPPLSKAYIRDGRGERLLFRNADFFAASDIDYRPAHAVTAIDRHARLVTLSDGATLRYDHLVIATGARNRRLAMPGIDLAGVLDLRTLADAEAIRAALAEAGSVVVIGGGFIGLEIAATANAAGARVTVLEATPRLMSRVVSPAISEHFLAAHRGAGIDVRLDAFAAAILGDGNGRAAGVGLADGEEVAGELVLVAAGIVPNAELAETAGLTVHDGVRVDDMLLTDDPSISAIGDCASFPFGHDGVQLRLESVQNAVDQAKCVARRLVGRPERYRAVPWFWSDQGPDKLQIAGLTAGADDMVVGPTPDGAKLTVLCFRRGELVGVETVNAPADHMAARRLLASGQPLGRAGIEAQSFGLAAMARSMKG